MTDAIKPCLKSQDGVFCLEHSRPLVRCDYADRPSPDSERVRELTAVLERLSQLGIPLTVKDACQMGTYDQARFNALRECREIAKEALSTSPAPAPEKVKCPEPRGRRESAWVDNKDIDDGA